MSEVKIIAATKISKGGNGEYPARYVVLEWKKGTSAHPYSRHMQVIDGKSMEYFIYGHYKCTYDDALADMMTSMIENNESYKEGNVSYIPGVAFTRSSSVLDFFVRRVASVDFAKAYLKSRKNSYAYKMEKMLDSFKVRMNIAQD